MELGEIDGFDQQPARRFLETVLDAALCIFIRVEGSRAADLGGDHEIFGLAVEGADAVLGKPVAIDVCGVPEIDAQAGGVGEDGGGFGIFHGAEIAAQLPAAQPDFRHPQARLAQPPHLHGRRLSPFAFFDRRARPAMQLTRTWWACQRLNRVGSPFVARESDGEAKGNTVRTTLDGANAVAAPATVSRDGRSPKRHWP
jgi:hypothetical protein